MRPLPINAVAGAPPYVAGLAIVRGTALTVIELAGLLDPTWLAKTHADDQQLPARFVTVKTSERPVALAVQAVVGVRTLPQASLRELPGLLRDAEAGAITSIGTLDSELLLVLAAARLLPTVASGDFPWEGAG